MGVFDLQKVKSFNPFSDSETLEYAAIAETHSDHPVAHAIKRRNGVGNTRVDEFEELAGKGVRATSSGVTYHAGNLKMLDDLGIEHACEEFGTVVHIVKDGTLVGEIVVSDRVRDDVRDAVASLRAMGVKGIYMLTGDKKEIAQKIGDEFNFDDVHADLLPHEKVEKFEEIKQKHRLVAFVGDGINDAPVIARADIGVAMGGIGRDAAVEIADVVIATDEPSKLADGVRIARKTKRIVWENIGFAVAVKFAFLGLGFLGIATMWEAVFADVGVAMLAILNSLRATFRT
jgi:Cd2+/Zn2+-exporting ATPase